MSYNITHAMYYGAGRLRISVAEAHDLRRNYGKGLPEHNFLEELEPLFLSQDEIVIEAPTWSGDSEGFAGNVLIAVLAKTKGDARIVLFWSGGERISALHVRDGVVREAKAAIVVEVLPEIPTQNAS